MTNSLNGFFFKHAPAKSNKAKIEIVCQTTPSLKKLLLKNTAFSEKNDLR